MLSAYLYYVVMCLTPALICAFIPLFGLVNFIAWYGRKQKGFRLPSTNRSILLLQIVSLTLLAAVVLAKFEIGWHVFWKCFEWEYCPIENSPEMVGVQFIPDTLTDWEAIIKHLLPPSMRETCYTGNQLACEFVLRNMIDPYLTNLWLPYPGIWIFSIALALTILIITRRIFPDNRKQKRS